MHLQPFLYRSAELSDDLLRVRTPDYCSARDYHVSTTLRGEGEEKEEKGRMEKEGEEGGEKGGTEREEKREGKKGKRGGRREVTVSHEHTHTHTHTSLTSQTHFHKKKGKGLVNCVPECYF